MKGQLPIFLLLVLTTANALAQNFNMNGSPITNCKGSFFDSGGQSSNYNNNQNLNTVICSNGGGGSHVRLDFSGTVLEPGDELCFFDGTNLNAPMISCASDYQAGAPFSVQATATNASGCLTVSFNSNGSGTAAGWSSSINCVASCQTVVAEIASTDPPANGFLDICPGERISFFGRGVYPQNNFAYAQSDNTTKFEWNFGDGKIAYGPDVTHVFEKSGGYNVQLSLTDAKGCQNLNFAGQQVRVAPKPVFSMANDVQTTICAGDTLALSASVNGNFSNENLAVESNSGNFTAGSVRSDSLKLPDGTGVSYKTSLFFTDFAPGQTLTNANDLKGICLNAEHSWVRDLEIKLTCPNGQDVVLHDYNGQTGTEVFLGIPVDNDGQNPTPGTGFDYCWTANAPNPTWLTYANTVLPPSGGTLPAGNYQSKDPLSDLVGCPLNGSWTISVTDRWPNDNGTIFSWGINFDKNLFPAPQKFTPNLVSWNWKPNTSIFSQNNNSIAASPKNGGNVPYFFSVLDEFGCNWDTAIHFTVLPFTHPNCYNCPKNFTLPGQTVCLGQSVSLNAALPNTASPNVGFESFPEYKFGFANHPPQNPLVSNLNVGSLGFSVLSNVLNQLDKVCMEIETDFDSDLNIFLRSPDGKQLELSTGNGGSGDNYKKTCFTTSATQSVIGSMAPFNGNFKPEGNWSVLNGAQVNGEWKLVVSDAAGPTKMGNLKWWSIEFKSPVSVTYNWDNPAGLSCSNCPNPNATPSQSTNYVVNYQDNFNCSAQGTANVEVVSAMPSPENLSTAGMSSGQMTFEWDAVPGAANYEIQVNGGGWVPANGNLTHVVSGLSNGQQVNFEVRAVGGLPGCLAAVASETSTYLPCTMTASVGQLTPCKCPGTATGGAAINVNMAVSPVKYYPDQGPTPFFNSGNIQNYFLAGPHWVIVEDAIGCRDTVYFTITEPAGMSLSVSSVDATCEGDNDGSATVTVTGGPGGALKYQWQSCTGGTVIPTQTANDLYAGCYNVTVTDVNNCTSTATVNVGEPVGFTFSFTQDSVNCYNGQDGSATVSVTGGQNPYTFLWANGSTSATATGLKAGFHTVTATDAVGCQKSALAFVFQPNPLTIDSIPASTVKCFNDSDGTATAFVKGGTKPYTYLWENGQTTPNASGLSGGDIYTLTVTDWHGCTDVSSTVVSEPPPIALQTNNIAAEKCAGNCDGSFNLTVGGGSGTINFSWSDPSIAPGTQNPQNLCPGTYTVTITDSKGCTNSTSATIDAAAPISVLPTPVEPKCSDSSDGSISVSVSGGDAPFTYKWNNNSTLPNISSLPCGNFSLTVTDASGCTKIQPITLDCPPVLAVSSIVSTDVKCFNDSNGSVSVSANGGTPPYSYSWNDPNNQISPTATNLPAGNYAVQITDANGCQTIGTEEVMQPQALFATLTATDVKCFGESSGSVSANVSGGTSGYTYKWNVPGTNQTASNLPAGTYNLTVTDANGCTFDLATATVSQPGSAVSATAIQTDTSCYGADDSNVSATAAGGNGAPYNYAWSNGSAGPIPQNLIPGNYSVTATDALGCTATTSVDVVQYLEIQANVVSAKPTCHGLSDGTASINSVSGGSGGGNLNNYFYTWSVPTAPNSTTVNSLPGGQSYFITITDSRGCTEEFSFDLGQPEPITVTASTKSVSCFGLSDGEATITGVVSENPVSIYVWSNSTIGNQLNGVPAGTYFITVTDDKGCTGSNSVEVLQPDELNIVSFDATLLKCLGDSTGAATAVVSGGTPVYTFQWETGATANNIKDLKSGTYEVTVTDLNGCVDIDSVKIDQPSSLNISLEVFNVDCSGDKNGRVKAEVSGGQAPYRFSTDGINFNGNSTFFNLPAGDHTFFVKDANGCPQSFEATIEEPLPLEISLPADTTIMLGDSLLIPTSVVNAQGFLDFRWRSGYLESLVCTDTFECSEIMVKPLITNTYTVSVTDENGCGGKADIRVQVDKQRGVYVPTGFTPNGDFENELLCVFGKTKTIKQINSFRVYDRWGELLYEANDFLPNDKSLGWDGTFRGKDCDGGAYVWVVEAEYIDGYKQVYQGNSQLIR